MANKSQNFQGKDTFERMNFLYQAGHMMSSSNSVLSSYYGHLCKSVAKKAVLRMEPNIKRTICKRCGNILRPGISANCSIDPQNRTVYGIECDKCKFVKRLNINAKYKLWLDDPAAITATISAQSIPETVAAAAHMKKPAARETRTDTPHVSEATHTELPKLSPILNQIDENIVQTDNKPNG